MWEYFPEGHQDVRKGLILWHVDVFLLSLSVILVKICENYSVMASENSGEPFEEIFMNLWDFRLLWKYFKKVLKDLSRLIWFFRWWNSLEYWETFRKNLRNIYATLWNSQKDYEFLKLWHLQRSTYGGFRGCKSTQVYFIELGSSNIPYSKGWELF